MVGRRVRALPVLYINLGSDTERRAHIARAFSQAGLNAVRVAALEPPFVLEGAAFSDTLSAGEIGCYASHMKAWRMLLASGSPCALVVEDYARLPLRLRDLAESILAALPEHWDLVHLYDEELHPARPLTSVGTEHELVRYSRAPAGCVAYLISRSGAEKLWREKRRRWPLDTDFRRPWHFGLDSYGIRPSLIAHEDEFTSAILKNGPRSRRRRGMRLSSPLHSLRGARWNVRKLGLGWWLYCLALNSGRRLRKAIHATARFEVPRPRLSSVRGASSEAKMRLAKGVGVRDRLSKRRVGLVKGRLLSPIHAAQSGTSTECHTREE